jgi:hypothetical protein
MKAKVFEVGEFIITAFGEIGDGRLDGVYVAEARAGKLVPVGAERLRPGAAGTDRTGQALRPVPARLDRVL